MSSRLHKRLATLEPILKNLWGLYLRLRGLYRVPRALSQLSFAIRLKIKLIAGLTNIWRKHQSPFFLNLALRLFYNAQLEAPNKTKGLSGNPTVQFIGWVRNGSLNSDAVDGIASLFDARVYGLRLRTFRPEIWYLQGGSVSPLCGFQFSLEIPPGKIEAFAKAIADEFNLGTDEALPISEDSDEERPSLKMGHLDAVVIRRHAIDIRKITSAFLTYPFEFSELLQVTAAVDLARAILDDLHSLGSPQFTKMLPEVSRLIIAKLLSGHLAELSLEKWKFVEILEPSWSKIPSYSDGVVLDGSKIHGVDGISASSKMSIKLVEPKFTILENVHIYKGGTVYSRTHLFENDIAQSPVFSFTAGRFDHVFGGYVDFKRALLRVPEESEQIDKAIILSSRADSNWFHWLIETAPKIFLVENLVPEEIPVMVSSRVPATGVEALRLITRRRILVVDAEKSLTVGLAVIPGPVLFLPDAIETLKSENYSAINPDVMRELRERILNNLGIKPKPARKVFLERGVRNRGIKNLSFVRFVLRIQGFEFVDPSSLSFEEQVLLFSQIGVLVTPGGATMANFLFLPEGSKAIILVNSINSHFKIPAILAALSGGHLDVVSGRASKTLLPRSRLEVIHGDFYAPIFKLAKALLRK